MHSYNFILFFTHYYLLQVVDEDDERALEAFMNPHPEPRRTLADLIMEKITEKGTEIKTQFTEDGSVNQLPEIDHRVKVIGVNSA